MRAAIPSALVATAVLTSTMSAAQTPVTLFAAGTLRAPLTELAQRYERETGTHVTATFGASGTLRERIAGGAQSDVFASANMEHPQALVTSGWAESARTFARNHMCIVANKRPAYGISVRKGAAQAARRFADFVMAPQGQQVLERFGFARP